MDQHRRPGQPPDDLLLEVVGDLVGSLEAGPGRELEVEVDLMLGAAVTCPEIVESDALLAKERADDVADLSKLLFGQGLVGETTSAVEQDPNAGDADRRGDEQTHDGIDPVCARSLDRDKRYEHPKLDER